MTLDLVLLGFGLFVVMRLWARLHRHSPHRSVPRRRSAIEEALQANRRFARTFMAARLGPRPTRKLAVVACMDCRLGVEEMLGLGAGAAHIVRNAGGIATADVLRSLILSHHLLGTEEILLLHHTDCACLKFRDDQLRANLQKKIGRTAGEPVCSHAIRDLDQSMSEQIRRVRAHPWIPASVVVRGCIYDVQTGALREIIPARNPDATEFQAEARPLSLRHEEYELESRSPGTTFCRGFCAK